MPTCYSPGQIIGVLQLRFLVLNEADLPVTLTTGRWRWRQKLKIILLFEIFLDNYVDRVILSTSFSDIVTT